MSRNLSDNARRAAFAQQTDVAFIILITITHPDLSDTIRLCNDPLMDLPSAGVKGVVSRGEEFVYLPFNFVLPKSDETGIAKAKLSIDNIDLSMVVAVRTATSSLRVLVEVILSNDPNNVEIALPDFQLDSATYDAFTISGDLSMEYYDLEPFPKDRFTPSQFPGLF